MQDPWYVILRDLTVILAAAAVIVVAVFTALVAWRLYKLAKEVRAELEPIMTSMSQTAGTVHDSGKFVTSGRVPSPIAAFGVAAGTYQLYSMVRQFQHSMHGPAAAADVSLPAPAGGEAPAVDEGVAGATESGGG